MAKSPYLWDSVPIKGKNFTPGSQTELNSTPDTNGNSASYPSKMALLLANFWTANGEGTQLVAHLTVINGNKLALEVC